MTPSPLDLVEHVDTNEDLDYSSVILPQSEPIPQQFWSLAQGWIPVVGRDIVACLFSRDWQVIDGEPLIKSKLSIDIKVAFFKHCAHSS